MLVYVDIDQGIHLGKNKVARNKMEKASLGFRIYEKCQILKHKPLISEECSRSGPLSYEKTI